MTLTIPQAGLRGGRAAEAGPADVPQGAEQIGQLGERMLQIGTALETDRLDRQTTRLRIDLTRDMGRLKQEVQQLSDPDEIDNRWTQGVSSLREVYQQRVDLKLTDRFGLLFDDMETAHSLAIGQHGLDMRASWADAAWTEASQTVGSQWVNATEAERAVLLDGLDDQIAADLENGWLTPQQAAERRAALQGSLVEADAIALVDRDPQAFLAARAAGRFSGLPADTLERYGARADANIARIQKQAADAAEAAERDRFQENRTRLNNIADIAKAGYTAADAAFIYSPEAANHPDQPRAQAAHELQLAYPTLRQMTLDELRAVQATEAAKPIVGKYQTETLDVLAKLIEDTEAAWANDAVGHASQVGLPVAELPSFSIDDSAEFVRGLGARLAQAEGWVQAGYTDRVQVFGEAEREALKAQIDASQDPRDRLALTGSILTAAGGDVRRARAVMAQVTDDPIAAFGLAHLADRGNPALLREIYAGQSTLAAENVKLPPAGARLTAAFAELGGVFADLPNAAQAEAQARQVADALYAARARVEVGGPAENLDEGVYRQALHEVLGGQGKYDGRDAKGGIQNVNDDPVYLPRGVSAGQVEAAFDALQSRDVLDATRADTVRMSPDEVANRLQQVFAAASGSGFPVHSDGTPFSPAELDRFGLKAIGGNRYVLTYAGNMDLSPVDSVTGQTFIFDLRALMREANP